MTSLFTGTLDKCKACDKTMSNYSSMDGVLYCKTHFEQLFKQSGNFSKNFQTGGRHDRDNSTATRAPNKMSSFFSGTIDKCAACNKTVYPLEKMTMEGEPYHKSCFKCAHGGCPLTHCSYAALNGVLYCKNHFAQLFMEKGNYKHVLDAATHRRSAVVMVASDDKKPDVIEGSEGEEQP
ncbi:LIM domain-containing protein PLIM2c-like [Impatiens glandulifera]|uniref:LIM domain-containing protein PLIM2c-like n=1 Tax=Impatiens glandulifera TaxID=253017 RepID=UPI001FB1908E|nr:LIM domain-containing protein PLIM2c-like [Impatiens glandulifera]